MWETQRATNIFIHFVTENLVFAVLRLNRGGETCALMSNSVNSKRRRLHRRRQRLLVNVVVVDASVDAWNSVNMHRFDVWCFFERSRTFDPAVGLGTSISGVEVPPPELRKVAHIPPTLPSAESRDMN